jgi:amino acid permease
MEPGSSQPAAKIRDSTEASSSLLHEEIVAPLEVERYSGTVVSGLLNLTQTILGAGILAMPSAVANVGVIFGSVLILVSASASAFGLYLLCLLAQNSGRNASFYSFSKVTWPKLSVFFDLAIAIKCFGVSVSYLVICRDLLPQAVLGLFPALNTDSSIFTFRIFWVSVCMWIVSPLAFSKTLSSLKYVSAFALSFVFYLTLLVVYFYADAPSSTIPRDIKLAHVDTHFFLHLPIFVFAFTCHQNVNSLFIIQDICNS